MTESPYCSVDFFCVDIQVNTMQFIKDCRSRSREKHSASSKASFQSPGWWGGKWWGLLSRMWDAERLRHPSDRSGVPSTVHILVHLLRYLLRMTEVRCGDGDSAEGGEGWSEAMHARTTLHTVTSNVWIKINDRGSTQLTASWQQYCGPWWFAECSSHWKIKWELVKFLKSEEIPL